jgi:phenylacetate-CoA ligase
MKLNERQLELIRKQIRRVKDFGNPFYLKKLKDVNPDDIKTQEDFENLVPFVTKQELRDAYPLGLATVPEDEIVRIHASSGTTGSPVVIPYTRKDIDDWTDMVAKCFEIAGITKKDHIQITIGYGLWTGAMGAHAGCEKVGAMCIPTGTGNTERQLQVMQDFKSTVICATSSYALLLAEAVEKRGLKDKIFLKKGIIGSERWGEKMRNRIKNNLGIELYDIYGLTECYGLGVGINSKNEDAINILDDYVYIEILDPDTGKPVPFGEIGEITLTTLVKEGAPLFRFRTHDLAAFTKEPSKNGLKYPRITPILGRSDDMVKVKGNIVFPSTIEDVIKSVPGTSSEYHAVIEHINGRDNMTLFVEVENEIDKIKVSQGIATTFKQKYNLTPEVKVVGIGELPRSEKKTKRIEDKRFE